MTRAALALGSNLGDRLAILQAGVADLLAGTGVELESASSVYETDPVGGPEQGAYLNAVIVVDTSLDPVALLTLAHEVEAGQGRVRAERWGPRTLDVDILSVADLVSDDPVLTLPHPRVHARAFVLVPWVETDPTYVVPGLEVTVADLLAALPSTERAGVRRIHDADVLLASVKARR